MPKYDEIYPEAPKGFISNRHRKQPPVVKYDWKEANDRKDEPICACGAKTDWVNTSGMKFVCSTECNAKVWEELISLFVSQQISGAF